MMNQVTISWPAGATADLLVQTLLMPGVLSDRSDRIGVHASRLEPGQHCQFDICDGVSMLLKEVPFINPSE
jgi:hypothetical protein